MQIMKANPSDTQPFNLLHEYESVCHEQVTLLKKTFRRNKKKPLEIIVT
jgi:hypothetical protein